MNKNVIFTFPCKNKTNINIFIIMLFSLLSVLEYLQRSFMLPIRSKGWQGENRADRTQRWYPWRCLTPHAQESLGEDGEAEEATSKQAQPKTAVIPGPGSPCGCGWCAGTAWSAVPACAGRQAMLLSSVGSVPPARVEAGPPGEQLVPRGSCWSPGESAWPSR